MISSTKDIWRLESKWSDHDRFWTDHDRKLAEVSYGFFSISLAPTNIVDSGHTKNYGKTQKTKGIYGKTRKLLQRRECQGKERVITAFKKALSMWWKGKKQSGCVLACVPNILHIIQLSIVELVRKRQNI